MCPRVGGLRTVNDSESLESFKEEWIAELEAELPDFALRRGHFED